MIDPLNSREVALDHGMDPGVFADRYREARARNWTVCLAEALVCRDFLAGRLDQRNVLLQEMSDELTRLAKHGGEQLEALKAEIASLRKDNRRLRGFDDEARRRIAGLRDRIDRQDRGLSALRDQISERNRLISERDAEIRRLRAGSLEVELPAAGGEPGEPMWWVVTHPNGAMTDRFENYWDALAEACALSDVNPGHEIAVLQAVSCTVTEQKRVTRTWSYGDPARG